MTAIRKIASCFITLGLLWAVPAPAQDTEVKQQVRVRVRLVPAAIRAADGAPVRGLKAEDFELLVDGRPVPIRGVDEYDYGAIREDIRQGRTPRITGDDVPKRRFILLFDTFSSNWREDADTTDQPARARGIQMSKAAAREWVGQNLLPTDEVAVIGYNQGPQLIQPYTAKKESILKAIDQVQVPIRMKIDQVDLGDNEIEGGTESRAQGSINNISLDHSSNEFRQGSKAYLDFYNRLGQLLASLPGTKNVILFSEGIAVHQDARELSFLPELRRATAALGSSATRVAAVSIAGMERSRGGYENDFLNSLARETGGEFYPGRGRLGGALEQAATSFDHFYEIFFTPAAEESADFHTVELRVKRDRVSVSAPKGYLGEKEFDLMSDAEREAAIDQGFWRPLLANELGAEMMAAVLPYAEGKAALHIRTVLPRPQELQGEARAYDAFLNLGRDGELFDQIRWRAQVAFAPNGQLDLLVPLPPGQTSLQFALTDRDGGGRAFLMNAFALPATLPATTVSPFYLSRAVAPENRLEVTRAPNQVKLDAPAALAGLVHAQPVHIATAGETLQIAFIYRGADFTEVYLQLDQGTSQMQMRLENLEQELLADGLRIVRGSFSVPAWQPGPVGCMIAVPIEGKVYRLGTTTVTIAQP